MSLIRFANAAAAMAMLAAPAIGHAQDARAQATTPQAAAQATGKRTTDAPAQTQTQGTAWAVQQAAQGAAATAPTAPAAPRVAPHGDIVQTLQASGQFGTFLKALDATNLTSVLKSNGNLTVFAPTDAAFTALPPGELDKLMADKAGLQRLLAHHIINARVDETKIKNAKGPVPSAAGNPIELDGTGAVLKADNADIVQAGVVASNGIINVVDQVLQPGAQGQATGAQAAGSAGKPAANTPATAQAPKAQAPKAEGKTH